MINLLVAICARLTDILDELREIKQLLRRK